jgi:hypothetical protein
MIDTNIAIETARERLEEAGFYSLEYDQLQFPETEKLEVANNQFVEFQRWGDTNVAPNLMVVGLPFSQNLDNPSMQVRLAAQAEALGPHYAMVAVQTFHPKDLRFDGTARKSVANGSFRPMAENMLRVIEKVQSESGEAKRTVLFGFSKAADEVVETAHMNQFDPNQGVVDIDIVGAWDCGRSAFRGSVEMIKAFNNAGPDLFERVIESNMPALYTARGIDIEDPNAEKNHDKNVYIGVAKYVGRHPLGVIALLKGYKTDMSKQQIIELSDVSGGPVCVAGRMSDSTICVPEFFDGMDSGPRLQLETWPGTHATADDPTVNAGFAIRSAMAEY